MVIVVMGVSGSGKSTVGSAIAAKLGWEFRDGDDFHPPENRAKMSQGIPLSDSDRWPWLDAISKFSREAESSHQNAVIACSALKESYRTRLRTGCHEMRFVFLQGSRDLLASRLKGRTGHFMPPSLLDSQLATLEVPNDALTLDIGQPLETLVCEAITGLGLG